MMSFIHHKFSSTEGTNEDEMLLIRKEEVYCRGAVDISDTSCNRPPEGNIGPQMLSMLH